MLLNDIIGAVRSPAFSEFRSPVSFVAGRFMFWIRRAAAACPHIMRQILIGIAVGAGPGLAADLEVRARPPATYTNWSGPYIGIGFGARFNAVDSNVTSAT